MSGDMARQWFVLVTWGRPRYRLVATRWCRQRRPPGHRPRPARPHR